MWGQGDFSLVPPFTVCTEQHQLCAEQVGTLYTLLPEGSRHRFVHSASFHLCILSIYAIFWYLRGNSPWCFFQRFLHSWDHMLSHLSRLQLSATLWTLSRQAFLSTGFSRQEYWSGLPFPLPGDLPNQGLNTCLLISYTGRRALYY